MDSHSCCSDHVQLHNFNYNRCCSRHCSHRCCCRCHRSRCRKNLCDTDFTIRLAGLQDGLNFRLRQLLWCEAEIELDNGNKVKGKLIFIGSNFVEMLLTGHDKVEEDIEEAVEGILDKELSEEPLDEEKEHGEVCEERMHEKGVTWIFSIDKIAKVVVN